MQFHKDGTVPTNGEIFVFGSNLAGRHGAGAAKKAYQNYGAKYGKGVGLCGSSYALPTKDENIITLGIDEIRFHISEFYECISQHPEVQFFITRIGCGLAGYKDSDIAPLFRDFVNFQNISWPEEWKSFVFVEKAV